MRQIGIVRKCQIKRCKFHRKKRHTGITDLPIIFQDSDGEKSDDLVVDVSNEVSIAV